MIEQATLTLLSGGLFHCTPAWNKQADGLDQCYKLYFPLSGEAYIDVDEVPVVLTPGTFTFISGYHIVRQYCHGEADTYWIHFVPEALYLGYLLSQAKTHYTWAAEGLEFWGPTIRELSGLFDRPHDESNHLDEAAPPAPNYRVQSMVLYFISELLAQSDASHLRRADPVFLSLRPAIEFMDDKFLSPPPLEEIAAKVHLAPNYFHRRFSETFHMTPHAYMLRRRMNMARQLLSCTALSVKEIADRLGYDNPFYFSRTFKKYFGVSPQQMRQMDAQAVRLALDD